MNRSSFGALVLYTLLTTVSSTIVSAHPDISNEYKARIDDNQSMRTNSCSNCHICKKPETHVSGFKLHM